jgi:hypothetical protein
VAHLLVVVCFLAVVLIGADTRTYRNDNYPACVNVTTLIEKGRMLISLHEFPFIDAVDYCEMLVAVVNTSRPKSVVVIVAPNSAGKSEGLQKMMAAWTELGHVVLDINLKGEHHQEVSKVMQQLSQQIIDAVDATNQTTQACIDKFGDVVQREPQVSARVNPRFCCVMGRNICRNSVYYLCGSHCGARYTCAHLVSVGQTMIVLSQLLRALPPCSGPFCDRALHVDLSWRFVASRHRHHP